MKLLEHEGKKILARYGVTVPVSALVQADTMSVVLPYPLVLKSQVPVGNRKQAGGIVMVEQAEQFVPSRDKLFQTNINGHLPQCLLAEALIKAQAEHYVSFCYNTDTQSPALMLNKDGGTGISQARIFSVDILLGVENFFVRNALAQAGMPTSAELIAVIKKLWNIFSAERALLVEINPLFQTEAGEFIAGDAKIILDDAVVDPIARSFLNLAGDIGILASGGGASMLNIDILARAGGRAANYVEYSGNPPASIVKELTRTVLSKPNLRGCWVIGGTANFTDIYETMLGFAEGLRELQPKPTFPIVVRRDGPRQAEAFAMLRQVAADEGYNLHLFGPEISMAESARKLLLLINKV